MTSLKRVKEKKTQNFFSTYSQIKTVYERDVTNCANTLKRINRTIIPSNMTTQNFISWSERRDLTWGKPVPHIKKNK